MRIRAVSVFEGIVYHCWVMDASAPCRPQLEVEALLRPGDADATSGPLLLSVSDYIVFAGGLEVARPCLHELAEAGRIVQHLGVDHIAFPTWTRVDDADRDDGIAAVSELRSGEPAPPGPAEEARAAHPSEQATPPDRPTLEVLPGGRDEPDHGPE